MFTIHATFDQFENDELGDYGIINVYWDGNHFCDVAECESFDIVEQIKMVTGLSNLRIVQLPFNPHGDGFEFQGTGS